MKERESGKSGDGGVAKAALLTGSRLLCPCPRHPQPRRAKAFRSNIIFTLTDVPRHRPTDALKPDCKRNAHTGGPSNVAIVYSRFSYLGKIPPHAAQPGPPAIYSRAPTSTCGAAAPLSPPARRVSSPCLHSSGSR